MLFVFFFKFKFPSECKMFFLNFKLFSKIVFVCDFFNFRPCLSVVFFFSLELFITIILQAFFHNKFDPTAKVYILNVQYFVCSNKCSNIYVYILKVQFPSTAFLFCLMLCYPCPLFYRMPK